MKGVVVFFSQVIEVQSHQPIGFSAFVTPSLELIYRLLFTSQPAGQFPAISIPDIRFLLIVLRSTLRAADHFVFEFVSSDFVVRGLQSSQDGSDDRVYPPARCAGGPPGQAGLLQGLYLPAAAGEAGRRLSPPLRR